MARRSSKVDLMLVAGVAAGGLWWARAGTAQSLQRNSYLERQDCECAYGADACTTNDSGTRWLGPWYLADPELRRQDPRDPGPGRSCGTSSGHGDRYGSGGGGYRGPVGAEQGHRYGCGGTARSGSVPRG